MASDCISCPCSLSPLSHKHPALSENMQHTAVHRAIKIFLCLHLYLVYVYWSLVFVCNRSATQRTFSSSNSKWCASAFILISQFALPTETVSHVHLGCYFTEPLSFFTIYASCCGLLPPHAERKFWICHQGLWYCHTQPYFTFKAHLK